MKCKGCGKEIEKRSIIHLFCSRKCREKLKHREEKKLNNPLKDYKCDICKIKNAHLISKTIFYCKACYTKKLAIKIQNNYKGGKMTNGKRF